MQLKYHRHWCIFALVFYDGSQYVDLYISHFITFHYISQYSELSVDFINILKDIFEGLHSTPFLTIGHSTVMYKEIHTLTTSLSAAPRGNNIWRLYNNCLNTFTVPDWQSTWRRVNFGMHKWVTFLGHVVLQGQVKPVNATICAISEFPRPEIKSR